MRFFQGVILYKFSFLQEVREKKFMFLIRVFCFSLKKKNLLNVRSKLSSINIKKMGFLCLFANKGMISSFMQKPAVYLSSVGQKQRFFSCPTSDGLGRTVNVPKGARMKPRTRQERKMAFEEKKFINEIYLLNFKLHISTISNNFFVNSTFPAEKRKIYEFFFFFYCPAGVEIRT